MEKISFTAIDFEKMNERIENLETTVMELRTPCYKKYALCIRITSVVFIIIIIVLIGIGAAYGGTTK